MVRKIVAINAGPRRGWNTDMLIDKAIAGAKAEGAEVQKFDLYKLERFTGCVSCFGCKTKAHEGVCIVKDYSKYDWTMFDAEQRRERDARMCSRRISRRPSGRVPNS